MASFSNSNQSPNMLSEPLALNIKKLSLISKLKSEEQFNLKSFIFFLLSTTNLYNGKTFRLYSWSDPSIDISVHTSSKLYKVTFPVVKIISVKLGSILRMYLFSMNFCLSVTKSFALWESSIICWDCVRSFIKKTKLKHENYQSITFSEVRIFKLNTYLEDFIFCHRIGQETDIKFFNIAQLPKIRFIAINIKFAD